MKYEIGKVTDEELTEIFSNAGKNFTEATGFNVSGKQEKALSFYKQSMYQGGYFLVARSHNKLLGWILLDRSYDYFINKEVGWINDIYVKKEYRKNGIAKRLIFEGIKEFRKKGFLEVSLNVYSTNKHAISLYKSLGFQEASKLMTKTIE